MQSPTQPRPGQRIAFLFPSSSSSTSSSPILSLEPCVGNRSPHRGHDHVCAPEPYHVCFGRPLVRARPAGHNPITLPTPNPRPYVRFPSARVCFGHRTRKGRGKDVASSLTNKMNSWNYLRTVLLISILSRFIPTKDPQLNLLEIMSIINCMDCFVCI